MVKYMLRLGEITLKSDQTRRFFLEKLISNLKKSFLKEGVADAKIENQWSRIFVETESPEAREIFSTTFGLISFSEVHEMDCHDLIKIVKYGENFFKDDVSEKTFAVRAKTAATEFHSKDIEIALGAALNAHAEKVDLEHPQFTAYVEVRKNKVYFFREKMPAPGGLPLGSEGGVLSLISGGFDSAVASYLMMKRGCEVDFLFFNLGGLEHLKGVYEVAKFLRNRWERPYEARILILDFSPILISMYEKTETEYWNIILKRFMFLAAEAVNKEIGYEGFATGSSIGQVSSQTLRNFGITTHGFSSPHFHPLLGFDKTEIIKLAQKIETYPLSEHVKEFCAVTHEHPSTRAKLEAVLREESKIDGNILKKIISEKKIYTLPSLELENIINIPPSANASAEKNGKIKTIEPNSGGKIILDMRSNESRKAVPIHGAVKIDLWEVFGEKHNLKKDKKYLAVCEGGVRSKYAAAFLRARGYDIESTNFSS